jgi:hypothetical protein
MAMTKKEKEQLDDAVKQVQIVSALHWTRKVTKDVPIPQGDEMTTGFDFNIHTRTVNQYYSFSHRHGRGQHGTGSIGSQNGLALYSTKTLALKAMRFEMEQEFARQLLSVDTEIEKEQSKGETK